MCELDNTEPGAHTAAMLSAADGATIGAGVPTVALSDDASASASHGGRRDAALGLAPPASLSEPQRRARLSPDELREQRRAWGLKWGGIMREHSRQLHRRTAP